MLCVAREERTWPVCSSLKLFAGAVEAGTCVPAAVPVDAIEVLGSVPVYCDVAVPSGCTMPVGVYVEVAATAPAVAFKRGVAV